MFLLNLIIKNTIEQYSGLFYMKIFANQIVTFKLWLRPLRVLWTNVAERPNLPVTVIEMLIPS